MPPNLWWMSALEMTGSTMERLSRESSLRTLCVRCARSLAQGWEAGAREAAARADR